MAEDERVATIQAVLQKIKDSSPELFDQVVAEMGLQEQGQEEQPKGYVINEQLKQEFEKRLAALPKGEGSIELRHNLIQEFRRRGYDRSRDSDAYPEKYLAEQAAQQAQIAAHQAEQNKPYTPPDPGQKALMDEFIKLSRAAGSSWERWQILQQFRRKGLKV